MKKLIDSKGRPVPGWMARMLSDGDRAARTQIDTFWADMRAKVTILQADIEEAQAEADELIIDLTRVGMGIPK